MRSRLALVAAMTLAALLAAGLLSALSIQSSYTSNLSTEKSKLASAAEVVADLLNRELKGVEEAEQATLQVPALIAAVGGGGTGAGYVSTGYVSAVTGAPLVVAVATPIRALAGGTPTGPVVGLLVIGYRVGSLQALADRLASLQHISLQVTDQAGVIVARTGGIAGHLTLARTTPELTAALAGRATASASSTAIAAGAPVAGTGWTVSATSPLSGSVAASSRNLTILIAAGLLAVLCIAGAGVVLVTGRMQRAGALHTASEAQLRTVLEALTEAIQVFDAEGRLVTRNGAAELTYELGDDERTTAAITPRWELLREDGATMSIADGPLAECRRTGEMSENVIVGLRRRHDGHVSWQSINTVPIRERGSTVVGYVSCAHDITASVEMTRSLRVLTRAAAELSSSLVLSQVIAAISSAASELTSSPGEPARRALIVMIDGATMTIAGEVDPTNPLATPPAPIPVSQHPYLQQVVASRQPVVVSEFDYEEFGPIVADLLRAAQVRNGALVPMIRGDRVFAVITVAGRQHLTVNPAQLEHLGTLATIGALAFENASAHQRAEALARTDPLTGVGNRRALMDRFAQLGRERFAIVGIDVDNLKTVNDAHGHDEGDALLASVARVMAKELRPSDVLARVGGDEFTALLVDCDAEGAVEFGMRMHRAVGRLVLRWGAPSISVGTAAGAAGEDPTLVAKLADRALYEAKQAARARHQTAARGG